jgi:RHS repeat-associated protein
MLGNRIHQASMEAGERWMLQDLSGKPLYAWNSRLYELSSQYDLVRRPLRSFVQGGNSAEPDASVYANPVLFERTIYGDSADSGLTPDQQQQANFRGRLFKHFDTAGTVATGGYDFKGNPITSTREVAQDYKNLIDWSQPQPAGESFTGSTTYDALNRPITITAPDNSVYRPSYNEANLLQSANLNLQGAASASSFVTNIDYNAKGQRTLIQYGNGTATSYAYEPLTFRMTQLLTRRSAATYPGDCPQPPPSGWPGCQAQNLNYTFDPMGNITHIQDDAQQTIYFKNQRVEPSNDYTYDAVYRLIEATGREHLGQIGGPPVPNSYNDAPVIGLPQHGDGTAMGRYLEQYQYDPVGNFLQFIHHGTDPANSGWTRAYSYQEPSLLEPAKFSNRLSSTTIGATTENYSTAGNGYDAHGSMLRMPQLQAMRWDFRDGMRLSQRQAVNANDADGIANQGERTYYVYDAAGQRVRKVTERQNGTLMKERIYLGGFEVYREYGGQGSTVTLERQTLHVMDDKQRIALVETKTVNTSGDQSPGQLIRYQFGNHLGSASLELNDQGQVISYEEYTPYGSTSYQAVDSTIKAAAKRYRYTGMERDEESGLNYHGARYYAPWMGRWSSSDPLQIQDTTNVYRFTRSNPIAFVDLSGQDSIPITSSPEPNLSGEGVEWVDLGEKRDEYGTAWYADESGTVWAWRDEDKQWTLVTGPSEAIYIEDNFKTETNTRKEFPWISRVEQEEGKKWEDLSDSAQSYWKMKLGHPEWQVQRNSLLDMTGSIVEESQSTDVQLIQGAMLGGILGNAMARPEPITRSGELNVKDMPNPTVKDEPAVIDSDADYSGVTAKSARQLTTAGARRFGNFVTFDNAINAAGSANRALMKAVNEWLGQDKQGTGTWMTGTHGEPSGIYGKIGQIVERFFYQDRSSGKYTNWNAVWFEDPLPPVYGPGKFCVLGWCYSSASLARQRP